MLPDVCAAAAGGAEVARQLEDPFGHEDNQLPVDDLHIDLNERLWVRA